MADLKQKIMELLEPLLVPRNAFVVDVKVLTTVKRKTIDVFVDTDAGITISQCADISRQLGAILETENLFMDAYILQVSSPGLTQPLMIPRQYKKNIGRKFCVRYERDGQRNELHGILTAATDVDVVFTDAKEIQTTVLFSEIQKCLVELPW
jgi:ribosome maturation factor RimP